MGYTTDFEGEFKLDKPFKDEQAEYLRQFSFTRRMKRNPEVVTQLKDGLREKVGLLIGVDGEFFVGENVENFGQNEDSSIINYNEPPNTQPGLWCGWTVSEDNKSIIWNGQEKFYNYIEWLEYLIYNFINKWGYKINGKVIWQGENMSDRGKIVVKNNKIKIKNL